MYNIGNMDQTMCRFDMAPKSTNNIRGEADVRIAATGGAKKGFTVALTALANGEKKPAYIVLKERNGIIPGRVFANLRLPGNVRVTASPNGWMTGDKMTDWIQRVWGDNRDDVRRLVVLDMARIHTMQATQDTLTERDTDVVYVPGGCTPICQPADVSWNAPFKSEMRKAWKEWRQEDHRTAQGNLRMATRQDIINWVSRAWRSVSADVIRDSFKHCGISSNMNGSEDHLLNDRMADALNAHDRNQEAVRGEAPGIIFDSDESSDDDFEGFSDED